MLKPWIIGATASLTLLCSAPLLANAAPAGAGVALKEALPQTSAVETVDYRRCWWRRGVRRCAWVEENYYGYGYGRPRAEAYPTGSTAWWRAMDYEGRGGHSRR